MRSSGCGSISAPWNRFASPPEKPATFCAALSAHRCGAWRVSRNAPKRRPVRCALRVPTADYSNRVPPCGTGPSGLRDWPRPFVFRAAHLDGQRFEAGQHFHFDAHLFDLAQPGIEAFAASFTRLAQEGIGPGRGRAELLGTELLGLDGAPSPQPIIALARARRRKCFPDSGALRNSD